MVIPTIGFDVDKKRITIGKHSLQVKDFNSGTMILDEHEYTWNRQINYYQNYLKILDLEKRKHDFATLPNLLFNEAYAQNRSDFPEYYSDDPAPSIGQAAKAVGSLALGPYWLGVAYNSAKRAFTDRPLSIGGRLLVDSGEIAIVTLGMSILVNKAYALAAPSCDKQVDQMKEIMNKSHVSLAEFKCSSDSRISDSGEQNANIAFWTPDRKRLPFFADWEVSELYVNQSKEVYNFDKNSLASVTFPSEGRTLKSDDNGFEKYKKSLEPYRKVLFEIGQNNSCWKCENEFNQALVRAGPGTYTTSETGYEKSNTTR